MPVYLIVNLAAVFIPAALTFHPSIRHQRAWRVFTPAILLPALFYIGWDIVFTSWGVWGFNETYLIGAGLFGLPLEEILFFFLIPYAYLFSYEGLRRLPILRKLNTIAGHVFTLLAFVLLGVALINYQRVYTFTAFLVTALLILFLISWKKPDYRGPLLANYLIIYAFPFLIVNGALTGAGLENPVVWYNNLENLGLRIITIPVEDFFYGLGLMVANIAIYEHLLGAETKKGRRYGPIIQNS